jgi:hypothetical protein
MYTLIKSESLENLRFFVDTGIEWVCSARPQVVIGDFGEGLETALRELVITLQYCQWHAVEATKRPINKGIQSKYRRGGHTAE